MGHKYAQVQYLLETRDFLINEVDYSTAKHKA